MRKVSKEKERYVKKLDAFVRQDITHCEGCPASAQPDCGMLPECFDCLDFVGLDPDISDCPCEDFGKVEALKRAHLALEAWDAGEHPWQKE